MRCLQAASARRNRVRRNVLVLLRWPTWHIVPCYEALQRPGRAAQASNMQSTGFLWSEYEYSILRKRRCNSSSSFTLQHQHVAL
ncbi:hypothetical protein KCU88_g18, partial [Aureobasidium melanogenum]